MANDFPQVVDTSTLTGVFNSTQLFPIGVEGQSAGDGNAVVGLPKTISSAEDAATAFGATSPLTLLIQFILGRGIPSVKAVSSKTSAPMLADRQSAWAALEDDDVVRIRLTDSPVQATLVALADSCEHAELTQRKQFCFGALPANTSKSAMITAAGAIASKRAVFHGPAVFDLNGNLLGGQYAAAYGACEVAKNLDISDSLNLTPIPATAGIELDAATGLPLFRLRTNGGTPIDDFEDLLTAGVSPFMSGPDGQAAFTHIRTTYTTDDSYDALMTLLIKDGVFLGIKAMLLAEGFLRLGNTASNRALAAKKVDAYLGANADIVTPVLLANGTVGYGVTVVASDDLKSFTVSYFGEVVRGTNVINVNGTLTIPTS